MRYELDLRQLKEKNILEKNYYDGIGDWLREKMRLAILEKERLGD